MISVKTLSFIAIPFFSIALMSVPVKVFAEQSFRLVVEQPDLVSKDAANKEAAMLIQQKINRWKSSWQNKNLSAYFGSYSSLFLPHGGESKAEWEQSRQRIIQSSQNISINLSNINVVTNIEKNTATATFNQSYKSHLYQDVIKKQLTYIRKNGDWLIASEKQI